MQTSTIEYIRDFHLFAVTLMLEYRSGQLDGGVCEKISHILSENLDKQVQLIGDDPYKTLVLGKPIEQTDLEQWKAGILNPPKRRIAVDQYIKGSLASLFDNKDLTKIHELNQFVFLHRFEAYAKHYPNHPAIFFKEESLTYAQLNSRANQLARFLQKQKEIKGIKDQKIIVGTFLPREPEWIIVILAIWKAGDAFIAIDPTAIGNSPDAIDDYFEKFAQIILDGKPAFIMTHSDHQYLLPKPGAGGFSCLCLDEYEAEIDNCSDENLDINNEPEDLAYILYTSGSTGKPKGVEIAHRGFMPCLEAHRECVDLTRDSVMAQYATCDFDAWVAETLILGIGGTLAIVPSEIRLDEKRCAQYYRDHKINVVIFTPAFLNKLGGPENFPLWKALFIVGESFDWELVKKWKTDQLQIVNGYGLTETTICATLENLDMDEVGKPLSIGKAILGTKIIIKIPTNIDSEEYGQGTLYQNPESPQSVVDQAGEPWFGGISLTRGYRGEAMKNNLWRFVEIEGERFYKSGDKAILRTDGRLEHQGRYSRMVKISGKRIELPSIEANLCEHFQLEKMQVAVTAVGNSLEDKNLTTLLVFLVEKENQKIDDRVIKEFIINTEKNIDKQSPLHIIWKKAFPTTQTKINLVELNKSYFETHAKKNHEASSVDSKISSEEKEILSKLQNCWKQVLSVTELQLEDDFFLIGGRSIDISPLIQAIRLAFPKIKEEINNALALECKTLLSQTKRLYSLLHPIELISLKKKQEIDAPYIMFCPPSILGDPEQDYSVLVSQGDLVFKKPYFDDRFQIYGLKARGLTDPSLMPTTLYSMAQDYALTIKHWIEKNKKTGIPIFILGWSSGGTLSPEIVNALAKYNIPAYAYVCDSIAPFPFHHFTEEEHTRELILLAHKLSSAIGLTIETQALSTELIKVQKPRDRIIHCFDYLIQRANENHKNILRTAKIIRLAEHNYIIRENLLPIRLYTAKNYLLNSILPQDKSHYWPKKCIRDIDKFNENIIDGDHFEIMQQPVLAEKITTQIAADYAFHKVKKVTEVLEKQSDYVVPFIKILEPNLKDEEKGQRPNIRLSQAVTDFLENPQKTVLLLQGESGIGKTIAITQLEKSLKSLNVPFKTLFLNRYTCEELQKSIREEIKEWNKESAAVRVVILEGYDERQGSTIKDYNYYSTNGLSDYRNLKVVFTCRSETLKPGYLTNFIPSEREAFEEYKLQSFNEQQIKSLMAIHLRKNNNTLTKKDIDSLYEKLSSQSELLELVKNPLLLTFVLNALPKLMESTDNLTRFKIYEAFNQDYFERGELKIKSQGGIEEDQDFQMDCRLHSQRIALAFFSEGLTSHSIDNKKSKSLLSSKKKEKNPLDNLFASEHKNLLKASPLQIQDNSYQFIHKSEQEFFFVNALIEILKEEHITFYEIQKWFTENKLTPQLLVSNESIIRFWQEGYEQYPKLKEKLFHIIYATRKPTELDAIGGIAITLLNMGLEVFLSNDLSLVNIAGAILDGVIMDNVNLRGSILSSVSFKQAWLRHCQFSDATVNDIFFGEMPYEKIDDVGKFETIKFANEGAKVNVVWNRGVYCVDFSHQTSKQKTSAWVFQNHLADQECDSEEELEKLINSGEILSPNGFLIATTCDKYLVFKDARKFNKISRVNLKLKQHRLISSCFSPDSKQFTLIVDNQILIIDPLSGAILKKLCGHTKNVMIVDYHPKMQILASAGLDKSLRYWDVSEPISPALINDSKKTVKRSGISLNGEVIARVIDYEKLQIYSAKNKKFQTIILPVREKYLELNIAHHVGLQYLPIPLKKSFMDLSSKHKKRFLALALSQDGENVFIGLANGEIFIYDSNKNELRLLISDKFKNEIAADWSESSNGNISPNYGSFEGIMPGYSCLSLSNDNKYLAVGWVNNVYIIDLEHPNDMHLSCIQFSNVVDLEYDIHRTNNSEDAFQERWHESRSTSLVFSPNSEYLAVYKSSSYNGCMVCLYDIKKKLLIKQINSSEPDEREGKEFTEGSVVFSPNSRLLIWGDQSGAICWYDIQYDLSGSHWDGNDKKHEDDVVSLAFSPDGKFLATASKDKIVKFWQVTYGEIFDEENAEESSLWSDPEQHMSLMGTPLNICYINNKELVVSVAECDIQHWRFENQSWILTSTLFKRSPYLCLRNANFRGSQNLSAMNKKLTDLHSDNQDDSDHDSSDKLHLLGGSSHDKNSAVLGAAVSNETSDSEKKTSHLPGSFLNSILGQESKQELKADSSREEIQFSNARAINNMGILSSEKKQKGQTKIEVNVGNTISELK